jgi:hypothetical protein
MDAIVLRHLSCAQPGTGALVKDKVRQAVLMRVARRRYVCDRCTLIWAAISLTLSRACSAIYSAS